MGGLRRARFKTRGKQTCCQNPRPPEPPPRPLGTRESQHPQCPQPPVYHKVPQEGAGFKRPLVFKTFLQEQTQSDSKSGASRARAELSSSGKLRCSLPLGAATLDKLSASLLRSVGRWPAAKRQPYRTRLQAISLVMALSAPPLPRKFKTPAKLLRLSPNTRRPERKSEAQV